MAMLGAVVIGANILIWSEEPRPGGSTLGTAVKPRKCRRFPKNAETCTRDREPPHGGLKISNHRARRWAVLDDHRHRSGEFPAIAVIRQQPFSGSLLHGTVQISLPTPKFSSKSPLETCHIRIFSMETWFELSETGSKLDFISSKRQVRC
jgi:hypothetical protein